MNKRFNIRVYGIWISDNKVLINEEVIGGKIIIKFPGGGLDWGEGTIDCLKREWAEELGLNIEIISHFYTTSFFQVSAFDHSQVISIYYLIKAETKPIVNLVPGERTYWIDWKEVSPDTFTLPIDKVVGGMLQAVYKDDGEIQCGI